MIFFGRYKKIAPVCFCGLLLIVVFAKASAQQILKSAQSGTIQNPVLNKDFPDPTVVHIGNLYYAYATQARVNGKTWNIQVASSTDLQHWALLKDALPTKPSWAATTQDFWAPHVLYDSSLKTYVLFYSGESDDTATGKCLGVAFANNPMGPFVDKGVPLVCGEGFVNIDPMAFVDPQTGKKYLYWGSGFKPIKVQEMEDDWRAFKKGTVEKNVVQPGSEKAYNILIEGAWLDYDKGTYYLYYSGDNCCGDKANYAVMVARADNPLGPFQRLGEAAATGRSAVLEKDSVWIAPGHNSVFRDAGGNAWTAYHAIERSGRKSGGHEARVFCLKPVQYINGWPQIGSATASATKQ